MHHDTTFLFHICTPEIAKRHVLNRRFVLDQHGTIIWYAYIHNWVPKQFIVYMADFDGV